MPLLLLAGCAKPELASTHVRAGSEEELNAFRAELVSAHGATALSAYDVALNELQLAGMDRGLTTSASRAAAMREQVNGQSVRAVEVLGWQARRTRLNAEIASMTATLQRDLQSRERQSGNVSQTVANRIQNVQDILAKLQQHLAETEQQLAEWDAKIEPAVRRAN